MRVLAAIVSILLVACGSPDTTDEPTTTITMPDLPDGLSTTTYEEVVADAANRAGVNGDEVELVSIEQKEFNDASLGCPEEGQLYAQVITPGFRVVVSAAGTEYDYRMAEDDDDFRLCEALIDPSG